MVAVLARREREGLSLRELSAKTGIAVGTLSWWSWRLRQDSRQERDGSGAFVEVAAEAGREEERTEARIVIELGNGIRVEVADQADEELLRRVVGVLRSC